MVAALRDTRSLESRIANLDLAQHRGASRRIPKRPTRRRSKESAFIETELPSPNYGPWTIITPFNTSAAMYKIWH